jgi:hypothetical protein
MTSLGLLMALVALVLLTACAKVANLLLSRSGARAREITVRLTIGAGRARIVRQLLTEGLLVALLGGGLGLGIALAGVRFFSNIPLPSDLPVLLGVQLDERVAGFSLVASVLSVFAFGLVPALRAARADLVSSLKEGNGGRGRASCAASSKRRWATPAPDQCRATSPRSSRASHRSRGPRRRAGVAPRGHHRRRDRSRVARGARRSDPGVAV